MNDPAEIIILGTAMAVDTRWCPDCGEMVAPLVRNIGVIIDDAYGCPKSRTEWTEECPDCGSEELTDEEEQDA